MKDIISQKSTKEEVADFFYSKFNISKESKMNIIKEDISGEVLISLEKDDFKLLGIQYGPIKKIEKFLKNEFGFKEEEENIKQILRKNSTKNDVNMFFENYLNFKNELDVNGKELFELEEIKMKDLGLNLGQRKKLIRYINYFNKKEKEEEIILTKTSDFKETSKFLEKKLFFSKESVEKIRLDGDIIFDLKNKSIQELKEEMGEMEILENEKSNLLNYLIKEKSKEGNESCETIKTEEKENGESHYIKEKGNNNFINDLNEQINKDDSEKYNMNNIETTINTEKIKNSENKERERETGIIFKEKMPKEFDYINIMIKLKENFNPKSIEVYNIERPWVKSYSFMKLQKNIYFSVCCIYINSNKMIKFGIRDEYKEILDYNKIDNDFKENPIYINEEKCFTIIKNQNKGEYFKIYNEPESLEEENILLLYLEKLYYLRVYKFNKNIFSKISLSLNYEKILDLILKIGIESENLDFTNNLILILYEKDIDIKQISIYLNQNKNIQNFEKIAPHIIYEIHKLKKQNQTKSNKFIDEKNKEKEDKENIKYEDSILCCNNNIIKITSPKIISEYLFGNTIKNLQVETNNNIGKEIKDSILEKIKTINKEKSCVLTEQTYKKIHLLELGIKSKIPIIIQGFTSAGKSFLSGLALEINGKLYIETALSENTTNEDLLGKNIIKENVVSFCPGILLEAYTEGKTLIINECDLAKPEILSCIIGCLTKEQLIISNNEFKKNNEFNLIMTMNGEIKGFTDKQRNILNSYIISKFIIIYFDEIKQEECEKIFYDQIKSVERYNEDIKKTIINLHQKMNEQESNYLKKSVDPIVTLRNLKYCTILGKNNISPRIAVEISYTARFSFEYKKNNNELEMLLSNLGDMKIDKKNLDNLIEELDKNNIFYDDNYLISLYLAKTACENGLHPLLIGKEGCGLSTFAKLLQSIMSKEGDNIEENNYLLCNYETTTEDLIGCQKPIVGNDTFSNLIKWVDGPILKSAKNGSPVILDNINYSKTQIMECLNTLLETNFKEKKDNIYHVIQNNEEKEIKVKDTFTIIGTMKDNNNQNMSKALINRFVSIYINEININEKNIEELIKKVIRNYNKSVGPEEKTDKLHQNVKISEKTIKELIKLFINEKYNLFYEVDTRNYCKNAKFKEDICEICNKSMKFHNLKKLNLKQIVRSITKIAILFEKLLKFKDLYSMEDCYYLFDFQFDKIDEKNKKKKIDYLIYEYLSEVKNNEEFFFDFEENKGKNDACKMILSLIVSDITNTALFIQGSPGSGKTCAVKFYGANRKSKSRDPIITINCHNDLTIEYLLGDYSIQNGAFKFIEGPLLNAIKEGYPILLDEFNLCSESVLMNISPIFEAKINDMIYLKGMDKPEKIKPGFLMIATGNFDNEKGRRPIPTFISNEIKILKIESIELNYAVLNTIMEKQYSNINKKDKIPDLYKISAKQIKEIFEKIDSITQEKFYLRQIKCLLDRIQRFYDVDVFSEIEIENCQILKTKDYKLKIPVIYIIISYIFPQLNSNNDIKEKLLEIMNKELEYNNLDELKDFINSKVEIEKYDYQYKCKIEYLNIIHKGSIYLKIEQNFNGENLPKEIIETFFWIRMTCSANSCKPSNENILLSGLTSYKTYLLYKWLDSLYYNYKEMYDTLYLTKKSEAQDLLGVSTLDSDEGIENQIKELKKYENKLKKAQKINNIDYNQKYIEYCIKKLEDIKKSHDRGMPLFSFHLGPLTKSFLYGKKLIIKGIENPHPSVIERLNPILENPRNLVLIEDNQKIFNDENLFKNVYGEENNKTSIPINSNYSVFLTSREIFNEGLSKAFLTRVTNIYCKSYEVNDSENSIKEDNFEKICSNIFCKSELEKSILDDFKKETINLKKILDDKIKIEFLKLIRWCKSILNIYSNLKENKCNTILYYYDKENNKYEIKYNYIVGISALRSIIDDLETDTRMNIIKDIKSYLPEKLYKVLIGEKQNVKEPFSLIQSSNDLSYIVSNLSGLSLGISGEPKSSVLNIIEWVCSSLDIADAILTSLASDSILILEGPPGIGKTEITRIVFEYLNISSQRINFSLSTSKEDVFYRKIPIKKSKNNKESETVIKNEKGPLLKILETTKKQLAIYKNGLILDEINLSSDDLLEQLYSYLIEIKNNKRYISPDGETLYGIGKIAVVATLNSSRASNYRISLSSSFLNLTHCFKLPDYTTGELNCLVAKLLLPCLSKNELNSSEINMKTAEGVNFTKKVVKWYEKAKENIMENEIITFREILKLKELLEKHWDGKSEKKLDLFLKLIFFPYIEPSRIKNFKSIVLKSIETDFTDVELKVDSKFIYLGEYINYPRLQNNYYKINYNFTMSQKEAIIKILLGLSINKTILLIGEIGSGKTFVIEKLAELIGIKLKIIQFHSDISSYDLIGGQEIIESKTEELFKELKNLRDKLIEQKYCKITEFIEYIETKNYEDIIGILKDQTIPNERIDLIKKLKENKLNINNFNLKFKKSFLLDAMENGYWILLDDANLSPQELERLMSLLEEEPKLNVFEGNINYKKSKLNVFEENNKKKIKSENEKIIHDNFRLFISASNESKISCPLKSRCFKVKMDNFNKTEDYAILISNYLSNSNFDENDIRNISINVGNLFNTLKKEEDNQKEENYLLKNYILSSVNLVHFSKLLVNIDEINDKNFSEILKYSIFSGFKEDIREKKIKDFIIHLEGTNEKINLKLIKNIKKKHEYCLSKIEIIIISFYYKNKWHQEYKKDNFKELNEQIQKELKKNSFLNENSIDKNNINEEYISNNINRKEYTTDLKSFNFNEIKEYISQIEEVDKVVDIFLKNTHDLKPYFLFFKYLICFLVEISEILKENEDDNLKLEVYNGKKKDRMFYLMNMLDAFEDIIPSKILTTTLNNSIINLFYLSYSKKYKDEKKKKINSFFEMISDENLLKIIKNYDIKFPEDKKIENLFDLIICNYSDNFIIKYNELKNQVSITITGTEIGTIYLNEISDDNINNINIYFKQSENKQDCKIPYNNDTLIFKFPEMYYNENNLLQIYWYFNYYLKNEGFGKEYLKKLIPEIFDFNEEINKLLSTPCKDNKWNIIKKYIGLGYKLIEGIIDISKDSIIFNKGLNLFTNINFNSDEKRIDRAIDTFNKLNNLFKKKDDWMPIEIKEIKNILIKEKDKYDKKRNDEEEKKREEDLKNRFFERINKIKEDYQSIKEYRKYFEENLVVKIRNVTDSIHKFNSNKEIELNKELNCLTDIINKMKKKISKYKENESGKKNHQSCIFKEYSNSTNNKGSKLSNLLKKYSELNDIIEIFEEAKNNESYENKELDFIIKMDLSKDLFIGDDKDDKKNKKLFDKKNNKNENFIIYCRNIVNAFLISKILYDYIDEEKNEKENNENEGQSKIQAFYEYIKSITELKKDTIQDLSNIFKDEDYIYLPKFTLEDIKEYFLKFNELCLDEKKLKNLDYSNSPKFFEELKKFEELKDYLNTIKTIELLYNLMNPEKTREIKFNNDECHWMYKDFNELKDESFKNPNMIKIKKKHNIHYNYKEPICKETTIEFKALVLLYLNKNVPLEVNLIDFLPYSKLNEIVNDIKENNRIKYGYRIMELFEFEEYRDEKSKIMMLILETINVKIFKNIFYYHQSIQNILSEMSADFIKEILFDINNGEKTKKILDIVQILLFLISEKYKSNYNSNKVNIELEIGNKKSEIANKFSLIYERKKSLEKEKIDYENNERQNEKNKKEYLDKAKRDFKKKRRKKNIDENEFKKSTEFKNYESEVKKLVKIPEKNWDEQIKRLDDINKNLINIKVIKDYNQILSILKICKIEKIDNIDETYNFNYEKSREELISKIKYFNELEELNKNYEEMYKNKIIIPEYIKNDKNISNLNIENNNQKELIEWIEKLIEYNNIFEIMGYENQSKNKEDILLLNPKEIEIKRNKNINFIYNNENEPRFLYKSMIIDLGLYIVDNCVNNIIGSITIQNDYKNKIKYKIIKENKEDDCIVIDNLNEISNLEGEKDIKIEFKINEGKIGLCESNFELFLYSANIKKESISCKLHVFIYVIPLILKFSLNGEYYSIKDDNNTIKINHYIENLKINYTFPGLGNIPKSLGIKGSINLNFYLFLKKEKKLFSFDIEYNEPKMTGLIIYDENIIFENNEIENIQILNDKQSIEKIIYVFNMSNVKIDLKDIEDNENIIIKNNNLDNKSINPGDKLEIKISNKIKDDYIIQLSKNKYLKIKKINAPKIKLNENNFTLYNIEKIHEHEKNNFTIFEIDTNYHLVHKEINGQNMNNESFSIFLLYYNKIIDFHKKNYIIKEKFEENERVVGFNKELIFVESEEYKNISIILSYKNPFISIFNNEQRQDLQSTVQIIKIKLESNNINDLEEALSSLIKIKEIQLGKGIQESVNNLKIINDKKISYENIIIVLLKYSLKFDDIEDFKKELEEFFKKMYSSRQIYYSFHPNEKLGQDLIKFLEKLSYIISFTLLCLDPGQLYENEINYIYLNNLVKIENDLKEEFDKCFKTSVSEDKLNKDFFFFNDKIFIEDKDFNNYEKEIRDNLYNMEKSQENIEREEIEIEKTE